VGFRWSRYVRCDKAHRTEECPYYKKGRDKHPDAQRRRHHDFGEVCCGQTGVSVCHCQCQLATFDGGRPEEIFCLEMPVWYGNPATGGASSLHSVFCRVRHDSLLTETLCTPLFVAVSSIRWLTGFAKPREYTYQLFKYVSCVLAQRLFLRR